MSDVLVIEIQDVGASAAITKLGTLQDKVVQLGASLAALKTSTPALDQLKTALGGISGGSKALDEVNASLRGMPAAMDGLKASFGKSISGLGRVLKTELDVLGKQINASTAGMGANIGSNMETAIASGTPRAVQAVRAQGKTIAAAARAEATAVYEAMVAGQANAKIKDFGALFQLQKAGAALSPYHKQVLDNWKTSANIAQQQLSAAVQGDRVKTENLVKSQTALLQNALKQMGETSALRDSSLAGIYSKSLARGNANVSAVRAKLKAEADAVKSAFTQETAALQAALKAMEARSATQAASLAGIYAGSRARGAQDIARVRADLKRDADAIIAAATAEAKRVQSQVSVAMNNASSAYTSYNPNTQTKGRLIDPSLQAPPRVRSAVDSTASAVLKNGPKPAEIDSMSAAMRRLSVSGNDVHSMSRGLASGFGALWLTWGNLLPLFAGAAISNGFMKTAKEGLQVAQTLETIAILGENTSTEMAQLTSEMVNLGTHGPHGPLAIAEAMKTLSLAGLKASEILGVTRDTMNFSLAGTTSIQTAADVLVSVTTAFGTGAGGFSRSADIIMRAAADSKASVESFGEAMKTASVVGQQYGATQEDVAQQIQYLANLGIQGSAAGTAIRNMYADITGRSGQVTKILKTLGLDFKDAAGNVVGLKDMTSQLMTKLQEYDPKSQGAILQAIFGERGAKSMIASLAAANTFVKDENGKLVSKLEMDQRKLAASYGDSAIAAIKMAQTTQSAFKTAGATLETTLFKAFTAMEPQLYATAKALQKAFGSPELLSTLSSLVSGVATVAQIVTENIGAVGKLVLGYVAFRTAIALTASAYGVIQGVLTAVAAGKAILLARTTAQTAAELLHARALGTRSAAELATATAAAASAAAGAKNLSVAGGLLRILPGVGTAIFLVAGAWMAYDLWSKRAAKTTADYTDHKAKDIAAALHTEANQIKEVTRLRRQGLTVAEAEARMRTRMSMSDTMETGRIDAAKELAKADAARARIVSLESDIQTARRRTARTGSSAEVAANAEIAAQQGIIAASEKTAKARLQAAKNDAKAIEIGAGMVSEASAERDAEDKRQLARQAETDKEHMEKAFGKGGRKSWDLSTWQGENGTGFGKGGKGGKGGKNPYEANIVFRNNAVKEIEKANGRELADLEALSNNALKILDARHNAGVISEGAYQAELYSLVTASEAKQLDALNAGAARRQEAMQLEADDLWAAYDKAVAKKDTVKIDEFTQSLQNMGQTAVTYYEAYNDKANKLADDGLTRVKVASINAQGAIKKAQDSSRDFWKQDREEANKLRALDAIAQKYKYASESVLSFDVANREAALAGAAATEKYNSQLASMDVELNTAKNSLVEFDREVAKDTEFKLDSTKVAEARKNLVNVVDALQVLRNAAAENVTIGVNDAALQAFEKARQQQIDSLTNGLSDALSSAVFDGGKEGGKKFMDSLRQEFLRKPFEARIRAIVGDVVGNVMDMVGLGAKGGAGAGAAGGFGNLLSAGSTLYKGGKAVAGWLGLGGSSAATSAVGALGSGTFGMGMSAAPALGATLNGSIMAGAVGTTSVSAAGIAGGGAAAGGGFGAMAAAAGPWIAAGLALYSIVKKFDNSGTYHSGGAGSYSTARGEGRGAAVLDQGLQFGVRSQDYSAQAEQSAIDISKAIVGMLDATATSFGKKAGYYAATAFADDSSKDGAWGSLAIKLGDKVITDWETTRTSKWAPKVFADGDKGKEQYAAALSASVLEVLKSTLSGVDWAQDILGRLGDAPAMDALVSAVAYINQVNDAFVQMGKTLDGFAGLSDGTKTALLTAAGGIDALTAAAGTYYENFYPEAERMGKATANLTEELAKAGAALPESKAAYRALVEEQLAAGESGAELAAKLLLLNGSFAQVTDYAEQAAKDAEQAAKDAITSLLDAVGIGAADMGKTFRDVLLGRTDAAEAGAALADSVTGGIYNAIAGGAAQQLTDLMMTSLITPVVQAAVAGTSISEAVSQSAIDSMVQQAQRAAAALGQIFSDPAFQAAIASVGAAITGVVSAAGAGIKPYSPTVTAANSTASDSYAREAAEPLKNAWESLIASIVQQTQDATRELSRLGMTGFEAALAAIRDKADDQMRSLQDAGYMRAEREAREVAREVRDTSTQALDWRRGQGLAEDGATITKIKGHIEWAAGEFDRLSAALAKLPPEVQAMVDAETALLSARNQRTAQSTLEGLATEVARMGFDALQKELAGITDRSAEYVKGLQDLGQGTDANIAAVKAWESALTDAALAAQAAAEAEKRAADKATADKTLAQLGKEMGYLGLSGIEKEIAGIAERGNEYRQSLVDLGQSTDANIKAVNSWQNAMMESALAAQAAADIAAAAQDVQTKFAARNSAGALKDRLQGAMGGKGTFAAQREGELWTALAKTADYEKQIELASQLTDMVLARQQLEVQNAERLLDFGKSLRSYVDSLKIGTLSPLTNAQKLAEAARQYQDTLGKAQGGDTTAQGNLQGIASSYLDLARTYYAGNEQFAGIFGSVTQALDALGSRSMTEAQQQLAVGTQSLSELQKLYGITSTAYTALNGQYETAVAQLAKMQDALVLQTDSLEQLKTLATTMAGLPAEIAVRMPVIDTSEADAKAQKAAADLLDELRRLREEVAQLRQESRQDAQMQAGVTAASADASAERIAQASAQAVRANTVQQGATLV